MTNPTTTQLRRIYGEIVRGCSYSGPDSLGFYIKHLDVSGQTILDDLYEEWYHRSTSKGLPTEKERLDNLIKDGEWGEDQEKQIKILETSVSRLQETKNKLWIKRQIGEIEATLNIKKAELDALSTKKENLIGLTAEKFADNKSNLHYIYYTTYKTPDYSEHFFSKEQFKEADNEDLSQIYKEYNYIMAQFVEKNIKLISVAPFFRNAFSAVKQGVLDFYGKPVVQLSYYQLNLFNYANLFDHFIKNTQGLDFSEIEENPDKLLETYNKQSNMKEARQKSGDQASNYVGMSKEEMAEFGIVGTSAENVAKEAEKSGGVLKMHQLIGALERK